MDFYLFAYANYSDHPIAGFVGERKLPAKLMKEKKNEKSLLSLLK